MNIKLYDYITLIYSETLLHFEEANIVFFYTLIPACIVKYSHNIAKTTHTPLTNTHIKLTPWLMEPGDSQGSPIIPILSRLKKG